MRRPAPDTVAQARRRRSDSNPPVGCAPLGLSENVRFRHGAGARVGSPARGRNRASQKLRCRMAKTDKGFDSGGGGCNLSRGRPSRRPSRSARTRQQGPDGSPCTGGLGAWQWGIPAPTAPRTAGTAGCASSQACPVKCCADMSVYILGAAKRKKAKQFPRLLRRPGPAHSSSSSAAGAPIRPACIFMDRQQAAVRRSPPRLTVVQNRQRPFDGREPVSRIRMCPKSSSLPAMSASAASVVQIVVAPASLAIVKWNQSHAPTPRCRPVRPFLPGLVLPACMSILVYKRSRSGDQPLSSAILMSPCALARATASSIWATACCASSSASSPSLSLPVMYLRDMAFLLRITPIASMIANFDVMTGRPLWFAISFSLTALL